MNMNTKIKVTVILTCLAALLLTCDKVEDIAYWQLADNPGGDVVWTLTAKDNLLFAGTKSGGVYSSADSGNTWIGKNEGLPEFNNWIVTLKSYDDILYRGGFGGIYRSTNNGELWEDINTDVTNFWVFAIEQKGNRIFAGTKAGGLFYTDNIGKTWIPPNSGLPMDASIEPITITNDYILASAYWKGIFKSIDEGVTWTSVSNGLPEDKLEVYALIENNGVLIAATNDGIYTSSDNASSWISSNEGLRSYIPVRSLIVSGNQIFAGEYGNVYMSSDNGMKWQSVGEGLPETHIYSLAIHKNFLFAGTGSGSIWRISLASL